MDQNSLSRGRGQRLRSGCLQGLVKRGRCCAPQLTVDLIGTLTPSPNINEVYEMLESLRIDGTLRSVHDPDYLEATLEAKEDKYQTVFELNMH